MRLIWACCSRTLILIHITASNTTPGEKPSCLSGLCAGLSLRVCIPSAKHYNTVHLLLLQQVFLLFSISSQLFFVCLGSWKHGFGQNRPFHDVKHVLERITSPMCVFSLLFFPPCWIAMTLQKCSWSVSVIFPGAKGITVFQINTNTGSQLIKWKSAGYKTKPLWRREKERLW